MTRKINNLVVFKGRRHQIVHVFDDKGSKNIYTGEYNKDHAGWYNILPLNTKRAQWLSTVSPDSVTDYDPKTYFER
jgi:hypothetical protein